MGKWTLTVAPYQLVVRLVSSDHLLPRDINRSHRVLGTPNAGISKFNFTSGKTHRLRLINAGADGMQRFSIDNHTMTVIAQDFVPVRPFDTKVVTLGVSVPRTAKTETLSGFSAEH